MVVDFQFTVQHTRLVDVVTTSDKLNKLNKSTTLLTFIREQTAAPHIGETDKESQPEQKPTSRNPRRKQYPG